MTVSKPCQSQPGGHSLDAHDLARVSVSFDDDTLLPNGGPAVAALLAQKLGVADLIDAHVTINGEAGANSGAVSADASQTIS
jgi:hypothetical protein